MGRQFSYYCQPEDLTEIQEFVFLPAGGRLFSADKTGGKHRLIAIENFALERERMGKESLQLLLLPPESISHTVFSGSWIDTSNSHLIEVNRCYSDGATLRDGRFWYEQRTFYEKEFGEKPIEFTSWAQMIFKKTKALLQRHSTERGLHTYTEWFGKKAWQDIETGQLKFD
jgi:hypothetical protein